MKDRAKKLKASKDSHRLKGLIRKFDDPVLTQVCEPVTRDWDLSFLRWMAAVCQNEKTGVGLAAPQIGVPLQAVFIFHDRKTKQWLVNPVIEAASEEMIEGVEGCLSFPGFYKTISRHRWVKVSYIEWKPGCIPWGPPVTRTFEGFEGVVVQHELDHLTGRCPVKDVYLESKEK